MSRHGKHVEHAGEHASTRFALSFGNGLADCMSPAALAAVADVNGKLYAGLIGLGKEYAGFVSRRLQEDLELPQKLAACKAPQDVLMAYTDFYRIAFNDYQREFARLAEMGQSLAAETADALQNRHKGSI